MARSYSGNSDESKSRLARLEWMGSFRHTYCVTATGEAASVRHPIEADNPEDAAMAFLDLWHPEDAAEVTVEVTGEDGRAHCYRLDIRSGEARPCA
jgi:hypothetical protein